MIVSVLAHDGVMATNDHFTAYVLADGHTGRTNASHFPGTGGMWWTGTGQLQTEKSEVVASGPWDADAFEAWCKANGHDPADPKIVEWWLKA